MNGKFLSIPTAQLHSKHNRRHQNFDEKINKLNDELVTMFKGFEDRISFIENNLKKKIQSIEDKIHHIEVKYNKQREKEKNKLLSNKQTKMLENLETISMIFRAYIIKECTAKDELILIGSSVLSFYLLNYATVYFDDELKKFISKDFDFAGTQTGIDKLIIELTKWGELTFESDDLYRYSSYSILAGRGIRQIRKAFFKLGKIDKADLFIDMFNADSIIDRVPVYSIDFVIMDTTWPSSQSLHITMSTWPIPDHSRNYYAYNPNNYAYNLNTSFQNQDIIVNEIIQIPRNPLEFTKALILFTIESMKLRSRIDEHDNFNKGFKHVSMDSVDEKVISNKLIGRLERRKLLENNIAIDLMNINGDFYSINYSLLKSELNKKKYKNLEDKLNIKMLEKNWVQLYESLQEETICVWCMESVNCDKQIIITECCRQVVHMTCLSHQICQYLQFRLNRINSRYDTMDANTKKCPTCRADLCDVDIIPNQVSCLYNKLLDRQLHKTNFCSYWKFC